MIYFDTSALIKLVLAEPESAALTQYVIERNNVPQTSSALAVTELRRTLRRLGAPPEADQKADDVLDGVVLLPVNRQTLDYAAALPGQHLRSLDAIHLASALRLRSALTTVVTYDKRMAAAAQDAGVPITAPA